MMRLKLPFLARLFTVALFFLEPIQTDNLSDNMILMDTDRDGVIDAIDIDDDNDGILDVVEDAALTRVEDLRGQEITIFVSGKGYGSPPGTDHFGIFEPLKIPLSYNSGDDLVFRVTGVNRSTGNRYSGLTLVKEVFVKLENDGVNGIKFIHTFSRIHHYGYTWNLDVIPSATDDSHWGYGVKEVRLKGATIISEFLGSKGKTWKNIDLDIDKDGIHNRLDLDSDNDGIPDNVEAQFTKGYITPSGTDSDNNGLDDAYESSPGSGEGLTPVDTDDLTFNDAPDYLDLDSDGDRIDDIAESGSGLTDANGDGRTDGAIGNNGLDNAMESVDSYADVNGNINIPKSYFTDIDGDVNRRGGDVDYRDIASGTDKDRDGVPDVADIDDDNDGILDTVEGNTDFDGDGLINRLDLDSDNDGIPDNIEAQSTTGYKALNPDDLAAYAISNGVNSAYLGGLTPINTETIGQADYLDLDADGDGIYDIAESGSNLTDANNDGKTEGTTGINGLDNSMESADSYADLNGNINIPKSYFTDTDGDVDITGGDVDYREGRIISGYWDKEGNVSLLNTDGDADNGDGVNDGGIEVDGLSMVQGQGAKYIFDAPMVSNEQLSIKTYVYNVNRSFVSLEVHLYNSTDGTFLASTANKALNNGDVFEFTLSYTAAATDAGDQLELIFKRTDNGHIVRDFRIDNVRLNGKYLSTDLDKDGDGVVDATDLDDDNDGILDTVEGNVDFDGDGIVNRLDLDSDNDGIPDNVEAQSTKGYTVPNADNTLTYITNNGVNSAYSGGLTPVNTDRIGEGDYLDLDADGDGIYDIIESGSNLTDANNDGKTDGRIGRNGLDNTMESADSYTDVNGIINTPKTNLTDTDDDVDIIGGDVDYREGRIISGYWDKEGNVLLSNIGGDADNGDGVNDGGINVDGLSGTQGLGAKYIFDTPMISGEQLSIKTYVYNANASYVSLKVHLYNSTDGTFLASTVNKALNNGNVFEFTLDYTATATDAGDRLELIFKRTDNGHIVRDFRIDNVRLNGKYLSTDIDKDGDGVQDAADLDDDNDGILDTVEGSIDFDGDGIVNRLDLDSDNDGIPDNVEAQSTTGYTAPIADNTSVYTTNSGVNSAYSGGLTPVNTDSSGEADYLNLDSDGDGTYDIAESGSSLTDANNDGKTDGTIGSNGLDNTMETADTYTDVNGNINTPKTDLTDTDGDVLFGGDVDYRDITATGTPMITQIYQSGSDQWIEITNIHSSNAIEAGFIKVLLYEDKSGEQTGVIPTASYTHNTSLLSGKSLLIKKSGATLTNIHSGASEVTNNVATFTGANDIITLSTTTNTTAWANRYEVVENIKNTSSKIRIDEIIVPNKNYTEAEWVTYVDDALSSDSGERHEHAPLISDIESTGNDFNIFLGFHQTGPTITGNGSNWTNGKVDRSRHVIINHDKNYGSSQNLKARKLTVNVGKTLTMNGGSLIVIDNVVLNGTINLKRSSQLIQVLPASPSDRKIRGTGIFLIGGKGTSASKYSFNYWSSPVTDAYTFVSSSPARNYYSIKGAMREKDPSNIMGKVINFTDANDGDLTDPITISRRWLYLFKAGDWSFSRETASIGLGRGYSMKGPGRIQSYTFRGAPNNGEINIGGVTMGKHELVGNPYPSAIDAVKFINDNSSVIDGTLYFWEHSNNLLGHNKGGYQGGYAVRNLTMGLAATAATAASGGLGGASKIPGRYIPVGQGFFVYGKASGSVKFLNSQRTYQVEGSNNSVFFKNKQQSSSGIPIVKLGLDYLNSEGESLHRQIGISFKEGNTRLFESGYDSEIFDLNTNDSDMYWNFGGEKNYVIAGVEELKKDTEVPLVIQIKSSNPVYIMLDEVKDTDKEVYLYDKVLGTRELLSKDSRIKLSLSPGVYKDRFYLAFQSGLVLNVDDIVPSRGSITVYYDGSSQELKLHNPYSEKINNVSVFDLLGRRLRYWSLRSERLIYNWNLNSVNISSGMYLIKVETEKGVLNKKILIK